MTSLFRGKRKSADEAKERLQLILVHDRADISPGRLNDLKDEMIELLSRYIEIDRQKVEISLSSERDEQHLVANIPLATKRIRRREAH